MDEVYELPNGKIVRESECNWFDSPQTPTKQWAVICFLIDDDERFMLLPRTKPLVH